MANSQNVTTDTSNASTAELPTKEYFTSPAEEERPMTSSELRKLRKSNPKTYVIPVPVSD